MAKIGTMLTGVGVVTTFNLTYVPQYIGYIASPQITGLKVTVLGDGVVTDLDAEGLSSLHNIRQFGWSQNSYAIPVADGLIPGKNVEIIATNSDVATPNLYAISLQKGSAYIQCLRQVALANSGVVLERFAYLAIPSATDADDINITYVDGLVQKVLASELGLIANLFQSEPLNIIDNIESMIDSVQITPEANRTIYLVRYSGADLSQKVI